MTTNELRRFFSDVYGLTPWPKTFNCTAETYGNVCHEIFKHEAETGEAIMLGVHDGVMFKGVELILTDFNNSLQHDLLDLLTIMPDSQLQEIVNYINELRATRRMRDAHSNPEGHSPGASNTDSKDSGRGED